MDAERWERVKHLLDEALAKPPSERAAYVAALERDDEALAREVESLLVAHAEAGTFIETPALARPGAAMAFGPVGDVTWAGRRLGPYQLVREIGHGGMGVVYLAVRADDEYRKEVAVKVIRSSFDPPSVYQRFRHERQILADLDHPNIARLIDGGSAEDGSPYFVMEYVDGLPIDRYCEVNGLEIDARLALFLQVCAAVQYAHQHLVVHRDLKAGNALVGAGGVPKLLDFGIAKLLGAESGAPDERTMTVMRAMTFESASPEQVRGDPVTTRTDVYALGVMLHRLLTGSGPYKPATTTTHDLARAICDEDARRPSDVAASAADARRLKGDLDTIVLKALQKDPARRYVTVEQFARDITRYLAGLPVVAQPDTLRYRATKFVMRHKAGVAASALIVLSLVGGVMATAWQAHVAREQRSRAERRFNDVRRLATSFLFEFHDAIEPLPGSTRARELVVRRASEYLDSLASEAANDPSLTRELAAAYDKVGDVQGLPSFANLGDTAGALRSHERSLALRQALVDARPSDDALQSELVETLVHLGSIVDVTRDYARALDYARRALTIREARLARVPDGVVERTQLAASYHQIGGLLAATGDFNGALENVRREAREFEALLAQDPSSGRAQRNAAIAYRQLGALLEKHGDRVVALENYRKAAALDEGRVRANGNDARARLDLSYDYASIGYTLSTAGDIEGALASYRQALAEREWAANADPSDVNARDTVVRAHVSIGQVFRRANRMDEALPHLHKAGEIASARYRSDPANGVAADRVASVYSALANTHASLASASKRPADALPHWRDARSWARKSIEIREAIRARAPVPGAASRDVDELATLIARCDAALSDEGRRAR